VEGFVELGEAGDLDHHVPLRQIPAEAELPPGEAPGLDLPRGLQVLEPPTHAELDLHVAHAFVGVEPHVVEVHARPFRIPSAAGA
jgi:hypothetical protein